MATEINFYDEPVIPSDLDLSGTPDGNHVIREHDGISILAIIQDGQVVDFEAESSGNPAEPFFIEHRRGIQPLTDGGTGGGPSWLCTRCGDHICCWIRQ
jgi:hypothetical protein